MWFEKFIQQTMAEQIAEQEEEEAEESEESEEDVAVTEASGSDGFDPEDHPEPEGTVECRWCEKENEYEVEIDEDKEDYTTRCSRCGLKVWIEGDGWEKYSEIHDISPGDKKPVTMESDGESDSPFGSITIDREQFEQIREASDNDRNPYSSPARFSRDFLSAEQQEEIRTEAMERALRTAGRDD